MLKLSNIIKGSFLAILGILEEVFPALASKVATFHNEERYAVLMLDEIQLTPGLDYDITTRSVIGKASSKTNAACCLHIRQCSSLAAKTNAVMSTGM